MEIKDLRQRENDPDLPTHVWWEVPPFLKILFWRFPNFNQGLLNFNLKFSKFSKIFKYPLVNWSLINNENLFSQ